MLKEVKNLHGWTIHATDGEIGKIDELLFDDEKWTVRYAIVETGSWFAARKVLLSPLSFGTLDWELKTLNVNLTREKIQNCPNVTADEPVSRQWETSYYDYYAWPYYWGGIGDWGGYGYPGAMVARPLGGSFPLEPRSSDPTRSRSDDRQAEHASAHLRSTKEVSGYGIVASDGHVGHIEDFLFDDETWKITYIGVDTKDWLPGKHVLISPTWIERVNWGTGTVTVHATRAEIESAPEWDRSAPLDAPMEDGLYAYFVRPRPIELAPERKTFVAVYETHVEAENAVKRLQKQGFDMTKLSLVGKDYHSEEEVVGYYTAGDRMKAWGTTGAFWGGIWSLMFGSAFFLLPGLGPILAAGPLVAWIVGALESAVVVGGLSALGGALFSIGIPNDKILVYESHLKAGKFLVIAHDALTATDAELLADEVTRHQGIK